MLEGLNVEEIKKFAAKEKQRIVSGNVGDSFLPTNTFAELPKVWIDRAMLDDLFPEASPLIKEASASSGNYVLTGFEINRSPKRLACFLGMIAWETNEFTSVVENVPNTRQRLMEVYGRYFNDANIDAYVGKPDKILNKIYANRLGNGDEASGDGWKYRGRGYVLVTGKTNYESLSKATGMDLLSNPEIAGAVHASLLVAATYWSNAKLNELADTYDIEKLTRKINGGLHGLDRRKALIENILSRIEGSNELQ